MTGMQSPGRPHGEPPPEGYLGAAARITSGPAPELVAAGYALEIADAPLLHRGLTLADLAHLDRAGRVRRAAARTGGTGLRRPARPAGLPGGGVPLRPGVRRRVQQPGAGTGAGPRPGGGPAAPRPHRAGRPAASRSGSRCGTGSSACTPTSRSSPGRRPAWPASTRRRCGPTAPTSSPRSRPPSVTTWAGSPSRRCGTPAGSRPHTARRTSRPRARAGRAAPGCRWTVPASPGCSGSAPSARTPATRCGRSMPWPTPSPRRR